jgi:uncharacterized membrane protein YgcG
MSSTILDLARRGHIEIDEVRDTKGKIKKDIYLTFKRNENDKLSKPENMIYDFFSRLATGAVTSNNPFSNNKATGIIISVIIVIFAMQFFFPLVFIVAVSVNALSGSGAIAGISGLLFASVFVYAVVAIIKSVMKKYDGSATDSSHIRKPSQVKWSEMASKLRMDTALNMQLRKLEIELKNEIKEELGLSNYFDSKGYHIALTMLVIGIIISFFAPSWFGDIHTYRPMQFDYIIPLFYILSFTALILLLLPNRVFGRFTKKGIETHNRIMAFKKFITDYSSLKKYPPSSIAIWDEIIVYATALGCADNVEKHMTKIVGKETNSSISRAASIGMASSISSSVRSSSSSGGGGRGGGRAGGGGGGAR